MKSKHGKGKYADNLLVTMRVTPREKELIRARADAACQNISDYLRERFFGGRPPLIFTDLKTINELRRIGGLLKHNFETLRQAKATQEICDLQELALRQLLLTFEKMTLAIEQRQRKRRSEDSPSESVQIDRDFNSP